MIDGKLTTYELDQIRNAVKSAVTYKTNVATQVKGMVTDEVYQAVPDAVWAVVQGAVEGLREEIPIIASQVNASNVGRINNLEAENTRLTTQITELQEAVDMLTANLPRQQTEITAKKRTQPQAGPKTYTFDSIGCGEINCSWVGETAFELEAHYRLEHPHKVQL